MQVIHAVAADAELPFRPCVRRSVSLSIVVMVSGFACRFPCFQCKQRFSDHGPSLSETNQREAGKAGQRSRLAARTPPKRSTSASAIAEDSIRNPDLSLRDAAHAHLARYQLSAPDRCNVYMCVMLGSLSRYELGARTHALLQEPTSSQVHLIWFHHLSDSRYCFHLLALLFRRPYEPVLL